MDIDELKETHDLYKKYIENWLFYSKSYEGGKELVRTSLTRNTRESYANWQERINEGINFNYSASIVDLFNFYLTERPPTRDLNVLEKNELWAMFIRDCDLLGTNFGIFLNESQKLSSVYGSLGVLINKPGVDKIRNVEDELKYRAYPYCCQYTLPNILNWKFEKDPISHRINLSYLKLLEEKNKYLIWYRDHWEQWIVNDSLTDSIVLKNEGKNPLNEIPFVWLTNIRGINNKYYYLGESDIKEISLITASIIRNISSGEEVIKYAGFPMFRKPMEEEDAQSPDNDTVAVNAVQEFNPEHGTAGKPDWMESKIEEPIMSILSWVDRKIDEAFRIAHLSGVHGQRKNNNEVASGLALRYEFQQLNAVLLQKSNNLSEAEENIIKYWLKWQNMDDVYEKITISRSKNFSIDDLSVNLKNSFSALENIASQTFHKVLQSQVVHQMVPELKDDEFKKIEKELDENITGNPLEKEVSTQDPDAGVPGFRPEKFDEDPSLIAPAERGRPRSDRVNKKYSRDLGRGNNNSL